MIQDSTTLVIAEDSDEDFEATCRALRKAAIDHPVVRCHDGDELLSYLSLHTSAGDNTLPRLVLLDLNLPATDGRAALKVIKQDPKLRAIPVVILTTSKSEQDVQECYTSGCNSYLVKPVDYQRFTRSIGRMARYWLTENVPPVLR